MKSIAFGLLFEARRHGSELSRSRPSKLRSIPSGTQLVLLICTSLAAGLVLAGTAIGFPIWKTEGAKVEPGVNNFSVSIELAAGSKIEIKTNKVTIACKEETNVATGSSIRGGQLGQGNGEFNLKSCAVTAPAKCAIQTIGKKVPGNMGTISFASYLVENEAKTKIYNALWSFNTEEFELVNNGAEVCGSAGTIGKLTGETLAEVKPEAMEVSQAKFGYQMAVTEWVYTTGFGCRQKGTAELKLGSEQVEKLSGESDVEEEGKGGKSFGAWSS